MALGLSYLTILALLPPLLEAQPSASSLGANGLTDMLHAEQQAELYANATLGKLTAYTDKVRAQANTSSSWSSSQAKTIESHADAKMTSIHQAAEDDHVATLHKLVALSVQGIDLTLNDTQFNALRVKRTDLMAAIDDDDSRMASLTAAYKNQLMKAELCDAEKVRFAKAQELQNSAQTAAEDLAIIVGVGDQIPSISSADGHQDIVARSGKLQQRLQNEGEATRQLILSLPGMIVDNIEGMSGGCEDKAQEAEVEKAEEDEKDEKDEKEEKDKKSKKGKHKKGKGGKGGKGGKASKHEKHAKALFFLVDPSAFPEELLAGDGSTFQEELGIQDKNIENLKQLQAKASGNAKQSLSKLGDYMEVINKNEFGAAATRAAATTIMKAVAADFAKKRATILTDLNGNLKVLNQLANEAGSDKYSAALAASTSDLESIKQLGDSESADQTPITAVHAAEDAEKARIMAIVTSVTTASQAMLDYAAAVGQMQEKVGVNQSDIDASSVHVNDLGSRMTGATQDAHDVAVLVIESFYAGVMKNVAQDAAESQAAPEPKPAPKPAPEATRTSSKSSNSGRGWPIVFLGAGASDTQGATGAVILLASFLGGLAISASIVATKVHQRSPVINSVPLLG